MEPSYLEPRSGGLLSNDSIVTHRQDLGNLDKEQQHNPGFVQSPVHNNHQRLVDELETSFSDDKLSSSPTKSFRREQTPELNRIPAQPHTNGSILTNGSLSHSAGGLRISGQSPTSPNVKGTVEIPWQYYQYLQHLAKANPEGQNFQALDPSQTMRNTVPQVNAGQAPLSRSSVMSRPQEVRSQNRPVSIKPEGYQAGAIYEEIPGYKMYSDLPTLPAPRHVSVSQSPSEESTDSLLRPSKYRKKQNPLYGENNNAESDSSRSIHDSPRHAGRHKRSSSRRSRHLCQGRCVCVGFLLLTIISCASLAITLLTASRIINFQNDKLPSAEANKAIGNKLNYTANINTSWYASLNETEVLYEKLQELQQQIKNLTASQSAQSSDLMSLSSRIPAGLIDPRLCVFEKEIRQISDRGNVNTFTAWVPNYSRDIRLLKQVAIAVSCDVNNYKSSSLYKQQYENTNLTQYQCRCSDFIDSTRSELVASCTTNYWMCPIIT